MSNISHPNKKFFGIGNKFISHSVFICKNLTFNRRTLCLLCRIWKQHTMQYDCLNHESCLVCYEHNLSVHFGLDPTAGITNQHYCTYKKWGYIFWISTMAGLYFNIPHIPHGLRFKAMFLWVEHATLAGPKPSLEPFWGISVPNKPSMAQNLLVPIWWAEKMVTLETKEKMTFCKGFLVEQGKFSSLCILMLKVWYEPKVRCINWFWPIITVMAHSNHPLDNLVNSTVRNSYNG